MTKNDELMKQLEHLFDDIDQLPDPEPIDYEALAKEPTKEEVELLYEYALEAFDLDHRVAIDWAVAKARHNHGLETMWVIKDKRPLVVNGKLVEA